MTGWSGSRRTPDKDEQKAAGLRGAMGKIAPRLDACGRIKSAGPEFPGEDAMQDQPLIFFHLKLVAKVALAAGVAAMLCLLVAASFLAGPSGSSYESIIRNSSITRAQMGPVMLLAGLVLVSLVGVVTWMIALYSSFRVAGPLYRFAQNVKLAMASDTAGLVNLRAGDSLKEQERHIKDAVSGLRAHHAMLDRLSWQASSALERGDDDAYADAVASLKALDEKARI
ncbi:MAG: hypothetical protein ACM34A_09355 [Bacillota bacterium]